VSLNEDIFGKPLNFQQALYILRTGYLFVIADRGLRYVMEYTGKSEGSVC
jgi:hypothetical protein